MEDKPKVKVEFPPEFLAKLDKSLSGFQNRTVPMMEAIVEEAKKFNKSMALYSQGIVDVYTAAMAPFREFAKLNIEYIKKLDEKHEEFNVKSKETFRVLKNEYFFYLSGNNYIVPDEKSFFEWYLFVKYGDAPFTIPALEKMSKVTAADLKEYHDYKVGQFHQVEQTLEIGKPTRERILPDFIDALKEPKKLPKLWKRLSKMKQPFVSERGTFILAGRPHAILFAFARALKNRDRLHETITIDDAYQILCVHFDVIPSPSLRQVKRGKRDVIDNFEAFNDILSEDE